MSHTCSSPDDCDFFKKRVAQSFLQILGSEYVLISGDFRPGKNKRPATEATGRGVVL